MKRNVLQSKDIEKKIRLSLGLYEMALEAKKTALKRKHPDWSDKQVKDKAIELIHKANPNEYY